MIPDWEWTEYAKAAIAVCAYSALLGYGIALVLTWLCKPESD